MSDTDDEWPCGLCYDEYDEGYGGIVPKCSTRCLVPASPKEQA